MSNFGNYKKFENVGIRSSNDTLIVMDSSNNNISLHSSDGGDDNVDTLSIKNIINKTPNMDLNLSSLNGTTINPVITINNNNGDCRIMTNLNVNGNINLTNGSIKTTGIGSFGSINCGVGTFTSIDSGSITSSNTLNAIVRRDGSGNFAAGTITADLTGSATLLENMSSTAGNTANTIVRRDGSGNFAGDTITANTFNGTASDSNKLNGYASSTGATNNKIVRRDGSGSISAYYGYFHNITVATTSQVSNLNATYVGGHQYSSTWAEVTASSTNSFTNKSFGSGTAGVVYFHGKKVVSSFVHEGDAYKSQNNITSIHNNEKLWEFDAAQFSNYGNNHQYGDVDPLSDTWYRTSYLSAKFDFGIYVGDGMVFVACDKRNKHLINEINDSKALDIIKKINVYTYYFKDKFGKPTALQYDVLAQEVQEHFPGAIITETDYLSNIVAKVEVKYINTEDNKFKMILETPIEEIKTNKNVRFYCYMKENTKENIYDILDLECIENNNTFIIEKKYDYIICIGTEEDDVLSVNKQVIYSLCHSAIQELDRQQIADKERITNLETKVNTLETANQQQQTKINTLETEVSTLKTENAELKSIIDKLKTANSFEEFKQTF